MEKAESHYKQTIPLLIEKYKLMITQCLEIVGQDIGEDIKDDKLLAVLKAKKEAAENAKWGAKQIDELENELNPIEEEKKPKVTNFAESQAE